MLNDIVEQLIREHTGGKEFFDKLDAAVARPDFFRKLWETHSFNDAYGYKPGIILSGKFGQLFANWLAAVGINRQVFVVEGGVRYKLRIDDLLPFMGAVRGEYVFFDDSFYSGRTRDNIKEHLEQLGARLTKTYVVYDGAREKDPNVTSLYRYYDNQPKIEEVVLEEPPKDSDDELLEEFERLIKIQE